MEVMAILSIVALVVALVALGIAAYLYLQGKRWMLEAEANQRVLQADMRALATSAVGVGERVRELEQRLRQLADRQEQQALSEPASQSYQQARKLAQRGADTEELVEIYGLTQGEAELIAMLNRMEQGAAAK